MDLTLLDKYRRQLRARLPLIGGWLQEQAVRALARDGSAEAVRLLADTIAANVDSPLGQRVLDVLRDLAAEGNVPAREALCRLVIFHDHAEARGLALSAGYVPHEETRRALFFYLTEQWPEYDSLDFEHRLLRQAYDLADERLRRRIAGLARKAGRLEWVEVVQGGKQGRRLGHMTNAEWRAARTLLVRHERWEDLWRLAQEAPPCWSAEILRDWPAAVCPVRSEDRVAFDELIQLAGRWQSQEYRTALHHRATLDGHEHEVGCLVISPGDDLLASGSSDCTIRLWRLSDGHPLASLKGHRGWVSCLAMTPDGALLASAGRDRQAMLWGLPAGEPLAKLKIEAAAVFSLAISPQGDVLACGVSDHAVRLWTLPSGQALGTLEGHEGSVSCLAFSPDGEVLASGAADGDVRLWDVARRRLLITLQGHYGMELDGVLALAVNADGSLLASGGMDSHVQLWSLPDGRALQKLRGHTGQVSSIIFHPEGRLLISGGGDHAVQLWELPSGRNLKTLDCHVSENHTLLLSPDGSFLVCASGGGLGFDHTLRIFSLPEGRLARILSGHNRHVTAMALSADSRLLATSSSDGSIRLWTAELARLATQPTRKSTAQDLDWLQRLLIGGTLSSGEAEAGRFTAALLRFRLRHDILVEEAAPRVIEVGAFDIEIEGY